MAIIDKKTGFPAIDSPAVVVASMRREEAEQRKREIERVKSFLYDFNQFMGSKGVLQYILVQERKDEYVIQLRDDRFVNRFKSIRESEKARTMLNEHFEKHGYGKPYLYEFENNLGQKIEYVNIPFKYVDNTKSDEVMALEGKDFP